MSKLEILIKNKNYEEIKKFLENKNVDFKEDNQECFSKITVDNEELSKKLFASGISLNSKLEKGKKYFYLLKEKNFLLMISNYYANAGSGMGYKTFNYLEVLNGSIPTENLDKKNTIKEFEQAFVDFVKTGYINENIEIISKEKYENITELVKNNKKVVKKALKLFSNKLMIIDLEEYKYTFSKKLKHIKTILKVEKNENLIIIDGNQREMFNKFFAQINKFLITPIYFLPLAKLAEIIQLSGTEVQIINKKTIDNQDFVVAIKMGDKTNINILENLDFTIKQKLTLEYINNEIKISKEKTMYLSELLKEIGDKNLTETKINQIKSIINS